MVVRVM